MCDIHAFFPPCTGIASSRYKSVIRLVMCFYCERDSIHHRRTQKYSSPITM